MQPVRADRVQMGTHSQRRGDAEGLEREDARAVATRGSEGKPGQTGGPIRWVSEASSEVGGIRQAGGPEKPPCVQSSGCRARGHSAVTA